MPFFGNSRAANISTVDIRRFIDKRQKEGAKNAEINRELAALKRAFNLAIQAGKLYAKPYIPMLQENNVRQGFFEQGQFLELSKHLPDYLRNLVSFAYITGWRIRSEVQTLEWRQVDFEAGQVRLEPGTTKNREGRVFPFTSELREVLVQQWQKHQELKKTGCICPWVFQKNGKQIKDFRRAWKRACKGAGMPGRLVHDFRRSAVRNLVRAGIAERVAMQLTGHKTRSVFERYNIVSDGDLNFAAERPDQFMGTITGTKPDPSKASSAASALESSMRP